jgi:hypothetical protein
MGISLTSNLTGSTIPFRIPLSKTDEIAAEGENHAVREGNKFRKGG